MEGYLRKLGGLFRRSWKRRYVILTHDSIAWLTEPVVSSVGGVELWKRGGGVENVQMRSMHLLFLWVDRQTERQTGR